MKLQLGDHLNYNVNVCEDKNVIQLTITSTGTDGLTSYQEVTELIKDIDDLFNNIMTVYMPAAKRPVCLAPFSPCSRDLSLSTTGDCTYSVML